MVFLGGWKEVTSFFFPAKKKKDAVEVKEIFTAKDIGPINVKTNTKRQN